MSIPSKELLYRNVKTIPDEELNSFADEVRTFFINTIQHSGGHFAGNLGVVELTIALHKVFNLPNDKLVWDVGHQAYIHKMLSGRWDELAGIRTFGGISGFPKREESPYDAFGTGHSSTSISAALGMAIAASLQQNTDSKYIAVVGDGALTGGMAFEALNNAGHSDANLLIVINDNHIGIDPNIGAIDAHLQGIEGAHPNFFENLSIPYHGPIDGHDISALLHNFRTLQKRKGVDILHIKTIKGKGFEPAENEQTRWHSTSKYVKLSPGETSQKKWQDVFADTLIELAKLESRIVGITPAMPSGSGMIKAMDLYPNRFFDVGIAEQHAVTFAAGMAVEGLIPFLNIYSTFLQRGYDQLIHDVALQNLPLVFCIDRAGLVGEDGPTHHGSFDISFLLCIPNLIIAAPANGNELRAMMHEAAHTSQPFAIRYPKGNIPDTVSVDLVDEVKPGTVKCLQKGRRTAIISTGLATQLALEALNHCTYAPSLYHFLYVKPLNEAKLHEIFSEYSHIITVEDGAINGGFGHAIAAYALKNGYSPKMQFLGIPDYFVTHGDTKELYKMCGYSPLDIANAVNLAKPN